MTELRYWAYALAALAALVWLMARTVRAAKKDTRLLGLMVAMSMIFGGRTTQPPPRHETEDQDDDRVDFPMPAVSTSSHRQSLE